MSYRPRSLVWINCSLISDVNLCKTEGKDWINRKVAIWKSMQMSVKEAKLVSLCLQWEEESSGQAWSYGAPQRCASPMAFSTSRLSPGVDELTPPQTIWLPSWFHATKDGLITNFLSRTFLLAVKHFITKISISRYKLINLTNCIVHIPSVILISPFTS